MSFIAYKDGKKNIQIPVAPRNSSSRNIQASRRAAPCHTYRGTYTLHTLERAFVWKCLMVARVFGSTCIHVRAAYIFLTAEPRFYAYTRLCFLARPFDFFVKSKDLSGNNFRLRGRVFLERADVR